MKLYFYLSALLLCTCFVVFAYSSARNADEQPTTMEDIEEPYVCIKRLQGRDGRDGRDGLPGRDGMNGERGEKGEQGEIGLPGPCGTHGINGAPGDRGEKGDLGERGPEGPKGDPGRDGVPGLRGVQGDIGDIGRRGPTGTRGAVGASGEKGEKGARGQVGPIGPVGERGVNGIPGLNGPPGATGVKGDKGEQGIAGATGPPGPRVGGATYVRWGRTSCPTGNGTELLYSGRAAGSYFTNRGGGTNLLCLPNNPEYLGTNSPTNFQSPLYGVEYHNSIGNLNLADQNVPCAVCYTPTRVAMVMIPAWIHCPDSWTEEYIGYLMTEYKNHRRIQHYCVDETPEVIPGEARDKNGAMFHYVDVACDYGIPCPPYSATNEITCAVCTK